MTNAVPGRSATSGPTLEVQDLSVSARSDGRPLVRSVSLHVGAGEVLGLVGESGSGKSMTASAIARLLPAPVRTETSTRVTVLGTEVAGLSDKDFRRQARPQIGFVFQNPATSLNPSMRVGAQIAEAVRGGGRSAARLRAMNMMEKVGIPDARSRFEAYPHQCSGGMQQRVAIAIALAHTPRLLIADEPTSALDVTIQAQICALIRKLADEDRLAVLFITHDIGIVANISDRVCVMSAGEIVETATTRDLFAAPKHPYTRALLDAAEALALMRADH